MKYIILLLCLVFVGCQDCRQTPKPIECIKSSDIDYMVALENDEVRLYLNDGSTRVIPHQYVIENFYGDPELNLMDPRNFDKSQYDESGE